MYAESPPQRHPPVPSLTGPTSALLAQKPLFIILEKTGSKCKATIQHPVKPSRIISLVTRSGRILKSLPVAAEHFLSSPEHGQFFGFCLEMCLAPRSFHSWQTSNFSEGSLECLIRECLILALFSRTLSLKMKEYRREQIITMTNSGFITLWFLTPFQFDVASNLLLFWKKKKIQWIFLSNSVQQPTSFTETSEAFNAGFQSKWNLFFRCGCLCNNSLLICWILM